MRILGIDPGSRTTAWALLDGAVLLDRGSVVGPVIKSAKTPGGIEWKRALAGIVKQIELRILEAAPDVICCEATQHAISQGKNGKQTAGQSMGQAVNTARTQEVIGQIGILCERHGIPLVMVHPASSAAALGVRRGATDGQVSTAAKRLFGVDGKWLAADAHEARAAGVALRGAKDWQLELRKRGAS